MGKALGDLMVGKMIREIKSSIILKIKRFFHSLGFIIERLPDENLFFCELQNYHEVIQKYKLKRIANEIKNVNNQKFYNKILKRFVPDWDDNLMNSKFVGNGVGESNLCVYRKVRCKNKNYFEKIYFNGSYDLRKEVWFFEQLYPFLKDNLNTARLCKVIEGVLITVVYFEFIDFVHLQKDESYSAFFNISRKVFELSKGVEHFIENAPSFIKDYTLHEYYRISIGAADKVIEELSNCSLTSKNIEQIVNLQPLRLTHGDIHDRNIFLNNYIVDWDDFGFFPQGFESAIIFAVNAIPLTLEKIQEILIEEYKGVIHEKQWEGFEFSCLYFYLVFTSINVKSASHIALQVNVFRRVEELYYKLSRTANLNIQDVKGIKQHLLKPWELP